MIRKRINKSNNTDNPIYSSVHGKSTEKYQRGYKQAPKKYYYLKGELGFDKLKSEYIAHLIKRFNEYKKKEIGKDMMDYQIFESSLKKYYFITERDKSLYHLPIEKFEELAEYIQKRISSTKFAVTLGRYHKNFSTFEEYVKRQNNE
jgi:hypothetical protein